MCDETNECANVEPGCSAPGRPRENCFEIKAEAPSGQAELAGCEAIVPFRGLLGLIEALPYAVPDGQPLRELMPGIWPTVGDLRKLLGR